MEPAPFAVTNGVSISPPTPEKIQSTFDLGVALALASWSALSVAVEQQWGGPTSDDKRDWLAGAISDLFAERPDTDGDDVADVLLQVMADEFNAAVEDGSEEPVAELIVRLRAETLAGEFGRVREMRRMWMDRQGRASTRRAVKVVEVEQEVEDDEEDESEEEDVSMGEAPALAVAREKPPPEVDEEGFTKVVGRKKK